ncbi:MAG: tetratricopeptide repeat protein, partial [Alphaproteobacteria bacterium]
AQAYFVRGVLASKPAAGLAELSRAIALNPYFADTFAHRGVAHFQTGAEAVAQLDFDRALGLQPETSPALFAKGVLRFRQGRFERARALFEKAQRLSPVRHPMAALWLAATPPPYWRPFCGGGSGLAWRFQSILKMH